MLLITEPRHMLPGTNSIFLEPVFNVPPNTSIFTSRKTVPLDNRKHLFHLSFSSHEVNLLRDVDHKVYFRITIFSVFTH